MTMAQAPAQATDARRALAVLACCMGCALALAAPRQLLYAPLAALFYATMLLPVWLAAARTSAGYRAAMWAMATVCLIMTANRLFQLVPDPAFISHYKYASNVLSIGLALLAVASIGRRQWRDDGFALRPRPGTALRASIVIVVALALSLGLQAAFAAIAPEGAARPLHQRIPLWEALVFQLVVVALAEELLCRGFLQSYLDRALGGCRRILGADLGWGFVIATLWFWLWHVWFIKVDPLGVGYRGVNGLAVLPSALLFGYLRAYTGSVWPAVALHGLGNALPYLLLAH